MLTIEKKFIYIAKLQLNSQLNLQELELCPIIGLHHHHIAACSFHHKTQTAQFHQQLRLLII